jgi:hypothetical protein
VGELLLPRTDAGAGVQAVVVLVAVVVALVAVRRNRELVWFVAGLAVLVGAGMALRTVH